MRKILAFIGTRPEAIKLAPLVFALREREVQVVVCATSQHGSMLQQALRWFDIAPDEDLQLMQKNQTPGDVVAAAMSGAGAVIRRHRPQAVFVQGDTATALAGALAGFYAKVPVAHVEAGLRSHTRSAPWPEESHRLLISSLASWHYAVTKKNADCLLSEPIFGSVKVTGNTVLDALLYTQGKIDENLAAVQQAVADAGYPHGGERPFILVTGHRRESFGEGIQNICRALQKIAAAHPHMDVVYAVHLNPRVHEDVHRLLAGIDNIHLLPPLDYPAFVYLMSRCRLILTDSGGIQEEAPTLNKPVLVMRDVTERPEVIECGAALLVGTEAEGIADAAGELLADAARYDRMAAAENPYGDGTAAAQIAECVAEKLRWVDASLPL